MEFGFASCNDNAFGIANNANYFRLVIIQLSKINVVLPIAYLAIFMTYGILKEFKLAEDLPVITINFFPFYLA